MEDTSNSGVAALASELRQRVTMFHAGDEKYSGEWLMTFRRTAGAWQVCMDCLNLGPPTSCDMELLQEFCAQTLARCARAFVRYHVQDARQQARDGLEHMLVMHASSPACIWKQLALALVCAELWLGMWSASRMLGILGLPEKAQLELLVLPTELLFCDRALPLNDHFLQRAAAQSLLTSCEPVLCALLTSPLGSVQLADAFSGSHGSRLQCLSSWLRAVRKSLRLLPGCDEAAPLRLLAARMPELLSAAAAEPAEACEVIVQIARWKSCPSDLSPLLQPLLNHCYLAADTLQYRALIPLFSELAAYCWPCAALGDMELDWEAVAMHSLKLHPTTGESDEDDEAWEEAEEGVLEAWQTFAESILEATGQSCGELGSSRSRSDASAPPPEKRKRAHEHWRVSPKHVAEAPSLQQMFGRLLVHIMTCLQLSEGFNIGHQLETTRTMRAAAQRAVQSWIRLANIVSACSWKEALLTPFRYLQELLKQCQAQGWEVHSANVWYELEVVLWLAASMLSSWPDGSCEAVRSAALVLELDACESAPAEVKPLLRTSIAQLAAAASVDELPQMLARVLQRPPAEIAFESGMVEMLEFTELPYAEAVETMCRRLCGDNCPLDEESRQQVVERLFALAFSTYSQRPPDEDLPEDTLQAQAALLQAMRHTMGSYHAVLCECFASKVLPQLALAAEAEAARAQSSKGEKPWRDTMLLYLTLRAVLPAESSAQENHPAFSVWRQYWRYFEYGLLQWPQNTSTEQPAIAAAEAIVAGTKIFPTLLKDALALISAMSTSTQLEQKLRSLREIVVGCPPCNPAKAASLLSQTIAQALASVSLSYQYNLGLGVQQLASPLECEEAFLLLAEAIRPPSQEEVGAGPCQDMLRPQLLSEGSVVTRGFEIANDALPGCSSTSCAKAILLFILHAVDGDVESHGANHRQTLVAALGPTCGAICKGLSLQEHMAEPELLAIVAEIWEKAGRSLSAELPMALQSGLHEVQVPDQSRAQFWQHVANRSCWGQQQEWQEHLQQIVCDWQRHQHVICT
mmetsp:Transcript_15597/g.35802  ORF Transcript_15597/g.35802 Transcript_15597/m.35802 type:complete len:1032 (-) Transcript_15597:74-3169(-)